MPSSRQLRPASALLLVHALLSCALASPPRACVAPASGGERVLAVRQTTGKSAGQAGARKQTKTKSDAKSREERERRQAVALLLETADAARSLDDLADRAEVQALAADALWPHDEQAARVIFMRAWSVAAEADAAVRRGGAEEEPGTVDGELASVRLDLLPVAAKRDTQLAEKLMRDLLREEKQLKDRRDSSREELKPGEEAARSEGTTTRRRDPWRELSPEGRRRFDLAGALMQEGEYESAARMAAPLTADGASVKLMTLLYDMRPNFARGADELYLRMLERTLSDAEADANDVLLLSSYIVSPELLVVVDDQGSVQFHSLAPQLYSQGVAPERAADEIKSPPPEVAAGVRALFYKTAAAVLLRPSSLRASASNGDALARYFALGRLLPLFEREAPQLAHGLHARRAALAAEIDAARRERLSGMAEIRTLAHKNPTDPLREGLERLARADKLNTEIKDESERDAHRLYIIGTAARLKLWERARTLADKIKDAGKRREAFSIIAHQQVLSVGEGFREDYETNDWERAAAFVRGADVLPFVRALGFAQAAELAARRGLSERASEILREAAGFAAQVESNRTEKLAAFSALTLTASRFDAARAWEFLSLTVGAADEIEGAEVLYPPGETTSHGEGTLHVLPQPLTRSLRLEDVFAAMTRLDFPRAAAEAKTLKNELGRAYAGIAVARARLDAPGVRKAGEKQ